MAQVWDGVARLVSNALRQFGQSPAPVNAAPLGAGGHYQFDPITEHNVQEHIAQNPAADGGHLGVPQDASSAAAAQAAYQQAMAAQQQSQFAARAEAMRQFGQHAGVADPMQVNISEQAHGDDGDSVPVLW